MGKEAFLSRAEILSAVDKTIERVECPEWGGAVYVRTLTGSERDLFEQSMLDDRGRRKGSVPNIRASLAAKTICDQDGNRLFTDKDIDSLGTKSAAALDRVFDVAQRLSGLSKADIEDLAKNSAGGQSGDSTSP